MDCAICGKSVQQQKDGLCLRCYVISHAIRLEPAIPHTMVTVDVQKVLSNPPRTPQNLSSFVVDVNRQTPDTCR